MLEEREHGGIVGTLGVERQRAEKALAELHLDQRVGQGLEPHAPVLLGDEGAPQALAAGLASELGKHLVEVLRRALSLRGHALLLHERTHLGTDGFGLGWYLEIDHWSLSLMQVVIRRDYIRTTGGGTTAGRRGTGVQWAPARERTRKGTFPWAALP